MKKIILSSLLLFGVLGVAYWGCSGIKNQPTNQLSQSSQIVKTISEAPAAEGRPTFQRLYEIMKNPETNEIDHEQVIRGQQQALKMRNAAHTNKDLDVPIEWEELGPNNVGGRTRALLVDKDDDQVIYAGSVTGGMFVSTDGGENWVNKINSVNSGCTFVSSIAQADDVDGTVYIGTGNSFEFHSSSGFGVTLAGSGMYKTTDGETYERLDATNPANGNTPWRYINRIGTQTIGGQTYLYAGTTSGLYMSTNGGDDWEQVTAGNTYDVQVASNGKVYAIVGNGLWRSDDGSSNFYRIDQSNSEEENAFGTFGNRKVLGVAKSDPNFVYIVTLNGSGCLDRVWQSKDGGDNFTKIGERSFLFDPTALGSPADGDCQGSYDLTVAVSPADPERIYFGGISLWSWGEASGWNQIDKYSGPPTDPSYIHPDKHGIFFHPTNPDIMYCTNDGGIYRTFNATDNFPSFQSINKGYNTYQCYGIAAGHGGSVAAGAQDNGTHVINYEFNSSQTAINVGGGDGIFTEISNIDNNIGFGGSQFARISRSTGGLTTGGGSCIFSCPCDPDLSSSGPPPTCVPWQQHCPNPSNTCTLGDLSGENGIESFFIHPFFLWEDTRLYYELENFKYEGPDISNTELAAKEAWNGQQFVLTTDPDKFNEPVENVYDVDENPTIYLGYDKENQTLLLGPNDDKIRRGRLFMGTRGTGGSKLWMTEDALKPGKSPEWVDLTHLEILEGDIPNSQPPASANTRPNGSGAAIGFSTDGDMVVMGTSSGNLLRVTGLNSKEYEADVFNTGLPFLGRYITEVAVNPNDEDNVMVTIGSTGGNSNVYITDNFNSSSPDFIEVGQGLPEGSVLTGVILDGFQTFGGDVNGDLLVGTLTGVYFGERDGDNVTWTEQNDGLGQVPVFRLRQEPMANSNMEEYYYCKVIYVGTHGRGMFRTTTLTDANVPPSVYYIPSAVSDISIGVEDVAPVINAFNLYPNPATTTAQLEINLEKAANLNIRVYDLSGKLVKQEDLNQLPVGTSNYTIDVTDLSSGNYIVTAESATQKVSKQLVVSH